MIITKALADQKVTAPTSLPGPWCLPWCLFIRDSPSERTEYSEKIAGGIAGKSKLKA